MNALQTLLRTFFFTILLGLLAAPGPLLAQNQTNDPLVDEQQYLFDVHRIGQAWNYTTGASNVKIGIYSRTGFIQNHEDLSSGRLASPVGSLQDPKVDIASEMAGIVGASTNNGVGMAGIDRAATLQSYSVLTNSRTCYDDSRCSDDEEEPVTFERPDGTQETYYLNLYRFSDQIKEGRDNGVDVHLVSFGLPSGDPADYSLDDPGDPNLFIDLSDAAPPENPNPDPFTALGNAISTVGQRIANSLCGGWFGSCRTPPDPSSLFRDEIGFAVAKDGGVVVSPAGNLNESGDMPPRHLPGMFDPYAVTVGGLDRNADDRLVKWDRTRPAPYVDVAAFAKDVVGVSGAGPKQYDTNVTSTAASASIGAGVSSLLKAEMPALTGEDVEEILKRTARDAGAPGEDNATGTGAIDAGAALAYVRNNDVQRSTQSVDYVISDEVVETNTELRGNGFWQYSSTNCRRPEGDLREFRARVSYSQTFREAPDAWTRWGGSNGVMSSGRADGAYYDPLRKEIEVVDADGRGFTVEGYYWEADFYNYLGERCHRNARIPKAPKDFNVAYTAVGTEGPPPLNATLSGPNSLDHAETGTWTASISGGEGSTNYDWEYRNVASTTWQDAYCSGSSCSRSFPNVGGEILTAMIRVTVTKGSETDVAANTVAVWPSGDGCSDPTMPCLVPDPGLLSRTHPIGNLEAQHRSGEAVQVRWEALGPPAASTFLVQHRADSTAEWATIGTVPAVDSASVDSSRAVAYRFQTETMDIGTHQFRVGLDREAGAKQGAAHPGRAKAFRPYTRPATATIPMSEAYRLSAYPNPVRERATLELAVKKEQDVTVAVYDVLGRRVTTLHEGRLPAQETERLSLNASRAGLSSGTYFVRVQGEGFVATERLTVVQ